MAPQEGIEPPTISLERSCSVQLSYWGVFSYLLLAHVVVAALESTPDLGRGYEECYPVELQAHLVDKLYQIWNALTSGDYSLSTEIVHSVIRAAMAPADITLLD